MRLKSISSFLASVLLIGFTIASGIIVVYYFFTTLPKVQTTEVSGQASKVLSCAGATFDVKVRNCNLLNGLVLWLPMDEGSGTIAYDYSGYGNNGTLYSGTNVCSNPPTSDCPTWVDGVIGKALSFDGVDDYVSIPSSPSLVGTVMSVGLWYNQARLIHMGLVGQYYSDSDRWVIGTDPANSYKLGVFADGAFRIWADEVALNNTWYHVVVVWDGSLLKMYVNGKLQSSTSTYNPFTIVSGATTYIGVSWYSIPMHRRWHKGLIDEVLIYNRALSEDEIKQLYYNGLTNKFNITIGLLNFGYADLGNSFTAIVYLKNGTILQLPLILDNNLNRGYYLEKTLTIDGYYPSYGLVDKIMVCSNDCEGVCSEIIVNNQC